MRLKTKYWFIIHILIIVASISITFFNTVVNGKFNITDYDDLHSEALDSHIDNQ